MLGRREFVYSVLALAAQPFWSASAQNFVAEADQIPPLPPTISGSSTDPRNDSSYDSSGFGGATSDQRTTAHKILNGAPIATTPYQVARYFNDVSKGSLGDNLRGYMRAWPIDQPANPVIVAFFSATNFEASSDLTAWCSAFMNWCMDRAYEQRPDANRLFKPTHSASSSSFRSWGKGITYRDDGTWSGQPKEGDIIVFQLLNSDGSASDRQGHVAFYVGEDDKYVYILGGNQFAGRPPIHCVNLKRLRKLSLSRAADIKRDYVNRGLRSNVLAIHSVRTARSLHIKNLNAA